MHAQLFNIHYLAIKVPGTCTFIWSSCALFTVYLNRSKKRHRNNLQVIRPERGRAVRKNTGTKQKWQLGTQSSTNATGLPTPFYISSIAAQPPPSFLCCQRPSSHRPCNLTSVYPVPALDLLSPSTPTQEYHTHIFSPRVQTISILSGELYSPTSFLLYSPRTHHLL